MAQSSKAALCMAQLHIGDDYGDNHATMQCQLPRDHNGPHQERFFENRAIVIWTGNDYIREDEDPTNDEAE